MNISTTPPTHPLLLRAEKPSNRGVMSINTNGGPQHITVTTHANVPFNDNPEADTIIRSTSSSVDFFVSRCFLSCASPFFYSMFTLPKGNAAQEELAGLPIIPVPEDEDALDALLRFCYPRWMCEAPVFKTLDRVLEVRKVAQKYAMDGVERLVRAELVSPQFVEREPLRVFTLAVRHGMENEARIAAKRTLRLPALGRAYIGELELITGGVYHRLQEYHVRCGELASGVGRNMEWIKNDAVVWFECLECRRHHHTATMVTISENRRKWVLSKWWGEYMAQATAALTDRPSGTTVIAAELVDEALGKASLCPTCRGRAFREMRIFIETFSAEVDRATSQVVLDLTSETFRQ